MSFRIIGTGSALPNKIVTNNDLSEFLETSDEWITTRTGIRQRRVLTDESMTELSVRAAQAALQGAGVSAADLDLIIFATMCGDYHIPAMACLVAGRIGARCAAFDINSACTGFIYALDIAQGYYSRKRVKKTLIVCADSMSRHIDWSDRASCVLFGDAAGAVVLDEGESLLSMRISTDGNADVLNVPYTGGASPFYKVEPQKPFLKLNGQEVYRFAVSVSAADLKGVIADAGLMISDISFVLLHQANTRIIEAVKEKSGIAGEKFLTNIERFGNTSAASIPLLLDEAYRGGVFKRGDYIALSAFGGGLSNCSCLLLW